MDNGTTADFARADMMENGWLKNAWRGNSPLKREVRLVTWLLAVVLISASAATIWQLLAARQNLIKQAITDNLNLAQMLNTYTEGVITKNAILLTDITERIEVEGTAPAQLQRILNLIKRQEHLIDQLDELLIINAQGYWLISSEGPFPSHAHSSDRLYFKHHRDNTSSEILMGSPIRSRTTNNWVITISQRYNDSHGQFAGVVIATLGIENFLRLFGKIDIGKQGTITLATQDGKLLIRHPFRPEDLGKDFSQSPNFLRHYAGAMTGTASFHSELDGINRYFTFLRSARHPLITTVGKSRDELLIPWRYEALLTLFVVLVLAYCITLIAWRLIATLSLRDKDMRALNRTREELLNANLQLEVQATQDQLTGLANRRRFNEFIECEAGRAIRDDTPLSLLLIDLDNFKGYNDAYGHVAGDACLQAVCVALMQSVQRPSDLAARYGGEELAVVLPNTDKVGALHVAERVRARIEALRLEHRNSHFGHVTASIGVATTLRKEMAATFSTKVSGVELALVEEADRALYQAKAAGRNCVRC